jgi:hypothetical protein
MDRATAERALILNAVPALQVVLAWRCLLPLGTSTSPPHPAGRAPRYPASAAKTMSWHKRCLRVCLCLRGITTVPLCLSVSLKFRNRESEDSTD